MQNLVDLAKSTLNSGINLKNISLPLIMYFLLQIIARNSISNQDWSLEVTVAG